MRHKKKGRWKRLPPGLFMYFGRKQLGDEVRIQALCVDAGEVPINPDSAPTVNVWRGSTRIFAGLTLSPTELPLVPGLFLRTIRLAGLTSGLYNCVIRWQASGFNGVAFANFEIVDGGGSDGTCVSMIYFQPPAGQFLVRQLDSGELKKGKNPA